MAASAGPRLMEKGSQHRVSIVQWGNEREQLA